MVKSITQVLRSNILPRVLSFDDEPFQTKPRAPGSSLAAVGIVTSGTRFEGMLYVRGISQDGQDATIRLCTATNGSKFKPQLHAIFLDGVTMGGFNVVDLPQLAESIGLLIIAVMRRRPNERAVRAAVSALPHATHRLAALDRAGTIHERDGWIFQFVTPSTGPATTADEVAALLSACTPSGTQRIPEGLRLAHIIGSAVVTGQSSSSA